MSENEEKRAAKNVREKLILAAIDEVEEVGFQRFSARRVAAACGVSCAAPYKHFKDKRDFLEAIVDYIADVWNERQERLLARLANETLRTRLTELALDYVRFMVENPRFRAILMIKEDALDRDFLEIKSKISERSKVLIEEYRREVGMEKAVAREKMYVVRSFIYGASLMFGNGELDYDDEIVAYVRAAIDREFDLPSLKK